MKFSLLLSVYRNDSPCHLYQALFSVWDEQIVKPDQIVLVKDGPLTQELDAEIERWCNKLGFVLKVVQLPINVGLGRALSHGLSECAYEWVARFDSDDISHPLRFKKQLEYIKQHPHVDIVGTWIAEFEYEYNKIHAYRRLPVEHSHISSFAKKRNPFNHMTVMYRKDKVLDAGSYQDNYLYEDYALWVRMINNGAVTANMPEVLVYARTGNGMEIRRGGIKYAKSEILAQLGFYQIGFINKRQFYTNLLLRVPVRLVPGGIRKLIYRKFLR
ncbi:TPA: glycosyltransferase [Vibrio cholerae]|uniref:glycosyltransferase n=1 Tax=Vibrio cholerae TaxID=666 RepID=UPI001B82A8B6|nr:glycosyltransferase [Vibrio cholerae]EIA4708780.1 glycosyltransferase [Vibrio cholerae]EJL6883555.1 glycosyltransferase [Vibrio cholerae]EKF9853462.1 glycosyltransferase [Vibrio cholerae]MCD1248590.1 amylovoran biosynthesis protein AmsE [Vibrio cholerae]MEB5553980.1 glycosyltransferase [Vibrio cholerae]